MKRRLKIPVIFLFVLLLLLFLGYRSSRKDELTLPVTQSLIIEYAKLSTDEPIYESENVSRLRLVSVDYANRKALIEISESRFKKQEVWVKEGEYSMIGNVQEVGPENVTIAISYCEWSD